MLKRWRQWKAERRKAQRDAVALAYVVAALRGDEENARRFKHDLERMDKERA